MVQGYLIGNGVTDPEIDGNALVNFAYFKSLISAELYSALGAHCNGSYWDVQPGVFSPHSHKAVIDLPPDIPANVASEKQSLHSQKSLTLFCVAAILSCRSVGDVSGTGRGSHVLYHAFRFIDVLI